jgi:hypothetical protein
MTTVGLRLGAPGVSLEMRPRPPEFEAVRLDVAGFVGVAPRGPVDEPTLVESWSAYRWLFGEGPGLLPWSVRAFFAQGGQRAYICRVSPLPRISDPLDSGLRAVAVHELAWSTEADATGPDTRLLIAARDEGAWGDALKLRLDFRIQQRFSAVLTGTELTLPSGLMPSIGTLLQLRPRRPGGAASFAWITGLADRTDGTRRQPVATLEIRDPQDDAATEVDVSVVTASLTVDDHDPVLARREQFDDLGLRVGHPRFLPSVLKDESRLARPAGDWSDSIRPDLYLSQVMSTVHQPGSDRWGAIGLDSFFGPTPPELLPVEGRETAEPLPVIPGADALALTEDVSLLAAPDLLWSAATASYETEEADSAASATFADCVAARSPTTYHHPPVVTRLEASTELDEILVRQQRLVRLAETQRRFVVLLDVPERLSLGSITRWRNSFDSSYAAAYRCRCRCRVGVHQRRRSRRPAPARHRRLSQRHPGHPAHVGAHALARSELPPAQRPPLDDDAHACLAAPVAVAGLRAADEGGSAPAQGVADAPATRPARGRCLRRCHRGRVVLRAL